MTPPACSAKAPPFPASSVSAGGGHQGVRARGLPKRRSAKRRSTAIGRFRSPSLRTAEHAPRNRVISPAQQPFGSLTRIAEGDCWIFAGDWSRQERTLWRKSALRGSARFKKPSKSSPIDISTSTHRDASDRRMPMSEIFVFTCYRNGGTAAMTKLNVVTSSNLWKVS